MDFQQWLAAMTKVSTDEKRSSLEHYHYICTNLGPSIVSLLVDLNMTSIKDNLPSKPVVTFIFHSFARLRTFIEWSKRSDDKTLLKKEYDLEFRSLEECEPEIKNTNSWKSAASDSDGRAILVIVGTLFPLADGFKVLTFTRTCLRLKMETK